MYFGDQNLAERALSYFLSKHYQPKRPLLLALSGGPDSMALLHLLLKKVATGALHAAHIDHRWRKESRSEAEILKELCEKKGVPFHLCTLKGEKSRNLEEEGRNRRLAFYKKLCQKIPFQAVLLAHHADDQEETILKRLFEGASLCCLGGMQEVGMVEGLILWRPLLSVPKKTLVDLLEQDKIPYFVDPTNENDLFLRARLRDKVIPHLNQAFGKNIGTALQRVAKESQDLHAFFQEKTAQLADKIKRGPLGIWWDFRDIGGKTAFEWKMLVKIFLNKEHLSPTYSTLEQLVLHLKKQSVGKKIMVGEKELYCDRGSFFLFYSPFLPKFPFPIESESFEWGNWQINCTICNSAFGSSSSWKNLFGSQGRVCLPYSTDYQVGLFGNARYPGSHSMNQWFSKNQVPIFLRNSVPMIWDNKRQKVVHEFLTGKISTRKEKTEKWIEIKLIPLI